MFMRCINFAAMNKQSTFDYKILASYLLPKGILEFFDVTAVNENHTGVIEYTGDERILLHIYLDEKDAREEEWQDLKPNGFSRFAEPRECERESAYSTAALLRSLQWVSDGYVSPRDTALIGVCNT